MALAVGVAPNVPGFLASALKWEPIPFFSELYNYAWFVGFGLSAVVYVVGMRLTSRAEPSR